MEFFKKHKILSFAVISFFILAGVNFYMIFELIKVIRSSGFINVYKKTCVEICKFFVFCTQIKESIA